LGRLLVLAERYGTLRVLFDDGRVVGADAARAVQLGEALDAGDAALIVIGAPELREQTERILSGATQRIVKRLDVGHHEFAAALAEAEQAAAPQPRPTA